MYKVVCQPVLDDPLGYIALAVLFFEPVWE
jgi:hypothetical protein